MEELVRKGIGLLILALLTSFLISAVIHYLQVNFRTLLYIILIEIFEWKYSVYALRIQIILFQKFHWTWLCEHDDENMILVLRCVNGVITIVLWGTWTILPSSLFITPSVEITLVQVSTCVLFVKSLCFIIRLRI